MKPTPRNRSRQRSAAVAAGAPRLTGRGVMTLLGLLLVVAVAAVQLLSSSSPSQRTPLVRLDLLLYDWRFQLWPPERSAQVPIVIVDLDEATQQREGRWPWDRARVAELLQQLRNRGALLVGFDVVFSEKTTNSVEQLLASGQLPEAARNALVPLANQFDGDRIFAEALDGDTVLGYFFHADGASAGELPLPFHELAPDQAALPITSLPDFTGNLAILTEYAPFSGFVVAIPDADGVVRRMPLLMRHQEAVYAALSLEMARLALGAPWLRLLTEGSHDHAVLTGVQIGRQASIPLDANGNVLVPYKGGARSYPTVSATRVLRGDGSASELAQLDGALVLVGTSALGLADLRTTPLQTGYPGVEAHANVLDAIIQGAWGEDVFYYQPDWEPGATFLLLLISGVLLAFYLPRRAPVTMMLVSLAWLAVVLLVNVLLWRFWHLALPLALPVLMVVALALLNIVAGYLMTNRQKHTIQSLFGEYVPPAYVERMVANPGQISLAGEQREMTVLFADVRNFTSLSEGLSPTTLKAVLNRYLSAVTEVIFEHHGTIDKYVGDLVMAFWNAPLDDADHAQHAVQAALAMQQRMVALREEFAAEGLPQFSIGIGINTGVMNVGDMGSRYRRAYTVLGDAVNLASRLESLSPFYGLPILVSDATRAAWTGCVYRTVDLVQVKGRSEPVEISQPLGEPSQISKHEQAQLRLFECFLQYYRGRQWPEAKKQLQALLADSSPEHSLYQMYANRIASVEAAAGSGTWSPVYTHEQK